MTNQQGDEGAPDESDTPADFGLTIQLVEEARGGDDAALDALFSRYLPRVRQIVALRTGHRLRQFVDVEDLVQDALVEVLRGLDKFEARSEGSFRNWLARCVESQIAMRAREANAKKRGSGNVRRMGDFGSVLHSSIFPGQHDTPSALARGNELADSLESALLEMPSHYRELIILRCICSMEYAEIATAMGFDQETAARMAFSRALKKLKETIGFEE
ncbi:MAG: sigma-70 family RNA polymerase sigma factor [Planctomycetota bacterium]